MADETLAVDVTVETRSIVVETKFSVAPGITVLFGPSGSGKSTVLAALAGLLRPARGSIRLGNDVWFDSMRGTYVAPHLRRVAIVFQSLALFPHFTGEGNVMYGMDPSLSKDARREKARALLASLRVGHLAERKPRTFSGGEAQRVAIARALAMSPRVVLLDEPFSALDQVLRAELLTHVGAILHELGVPTVFVTHHAGEGRALGDRAICMAAGRIVKQGTVDEALPDAGRSM